jgi:hypothetical protein
MSPKNLCLLNESKGALSFFEDIRCCWISDLADLYGVETRVLLQAIRRNARRFPRDFMFRLSAEEFRVLTSQFVMSKKRRGGRRYRPYVFTEQEIPMLLQKSLDTGADLASLPIDHINASHLL